MLECARSEQRRERNQEKSLERLRNLLCIDVKCVYLINVWMSCEREFDFFVVASKRNLPTETGDMIMAAKKKAAKKKGAKKKAKKKAKR